MTVEVPDVTVEDAAGLVEGGALLLDVREPDEWQAGHAPGAGHIPLGELGWRVEGLPNDRSIVCVCRVGGRSARATEALRGAGYEVVNLAGGMRAWAAAGQPVVTDDGSAGSVI